MPFHLYIHLPFCRRRCPYCDFVKMVTKGDDRARLVEHLVHEIRLAQGSVKWSGPIRTVYFGGGTPSLHPPEEINLILSEIRQCWTVADNAEITIEVNPGTVSLQYFRDLFALGINRVSLGGQSFSGRKLQILYRDHTPMEITEAYTSARAAGIESISVDMIFGLPGETMIEWEADLASMLNLAPNHVSLYNLEYHEATPFARWRSSGRILPLADDLEADMYLLTHDLLLDHGYEHYEVSNFARPGQRSRHNSAYWQSRPYLGLGPGAHSFDGFKVRHHNVPDLHSYFSAIRSGHLPIAHSQTLSPREIFEEWVGLQLRQSDGLDWAECNRLFGSGVTDHLRATARQIDGSVWTSILPRLSLSPSGWFRENSILLFLFERVKL